MMPLLDTLPANRAKVLKAASRHEASNIRALYKARSRIE